MLFSLNISEKSDTTSNTLNVVVLVNIAFSFDYSKKKKTGHKNLVHTHISQSNTIPMLFIVLTS